MKIMTMRILIMMLMRLIETDEELEEIRKNKKIF